VRVQATSIQRKAASGGRETFIHGLAGDDLINSVAGCVCGLLEKYIYRQSMEEILSQRRPVVSTQPESPVQRQSRLRKEEERKFIRELIREARQENHD